MAVNFDSDTISRQAAIDCVCYDQEYTIECLEKLPPAQPEPCEDAVSRLSAISHFRGIADATNPKEKYNEGFVDGLEFCIAHLSTMPPVTQKQHTGKWEITEAYPHNVYCSKCHKRFAQTHWTVWEDGSLPRDFCPNCGAKMEGVSE